MDFQIFAVELRCFNGERVGIAFRIYSWGLSAGSHIGFQRQFGFYRSVGWLLSRRYFSGSSRRRLPFDSFENYD